MRANQEITERIRYVEGFEALVTGGAFRHGSSPEYAFSRAASRKTTVGEWISTRFRSTYPGCIPTVIRPNGEKVGDDVPIGVARDAYHQLNLRSCQYPRYGQSLTYEFSDRVEKTVLEVRTLLLRAGIQADFDRFKLLWWESFYVKGSIRNIHLPVFQHRSLSGLLQSLGVPFKLEFHSNILYASSNLYEAANDYKFFGPVEYQKLVEISQ